MYIEKREELKTELDKVGAGPRLILFGNGKADTWLFYNKDTQKSNGGGAATHEPYIKDQKDVVFVFGDNVGKNKEYKDGLKKAYPADWQSKYYLLDTGDKTFGHGGGGQAASMLNNSDGTGSKWAPNIVGIPTVDTYASDEVKKTEEYADKIKSAIDAACEEIKIFLRLGRTVVIPALDKDKTSLGTNLAGNDPRIIGHLNQRIKELEKFVADLNAGREERIQESELEKFLGSRPTPASVTANNPIDSVSIKSSSSSSSSTSTPQKLDKGKEIDISEDEGNEENDNQVDADSMVIDSISLSSNENKSLSNPKKRSREGDSENETSEEENNLILKALRNYKPTENEIEKHNKL